MKKLGDSKVKRYINIVDIKSVFTDIFCNFKDKFRFS